jgi:hypothetical protein
MPLKNLQWAVVGIGLLATLPALPSGAGAANGEIPSECQDPNLSAAAEARCNFIARTPNLCLRSQLSEATRRFCDELAGTPEPTPGITISPDVPADIPGGATAASLADAANFAWQEFIALNWPAMAGTRDTPDKSQLFGDPAYDGPLVWHTYRHKVEIYPGQGTPPGFDAADTNFGYNAVPPQYIYNADQLGQGATGTGEVPPCDGQEPVATPSFINLDEVSQIGLASMFAGAAPQFAQTNSNPLLVRFLAKANQSHYVYVVNPDALEPGGDPLYIGTGLLPTDANADDAKDCTKLPAGETTTFCTAKANFLAVSQGNGTPTTLTEPFISFPAGTIHAKSAWRELTADEESSGRFYTATVRYYEAADAGADEARCYREGTWGLIGLHIEQKTPTAPYFIFATFEQADNLQTATGTPVENAIGQPIVRPTSTTTPELDYEDGNPPTLTIVGDQYCESPGSRLFYIENTGFSGLPSGGPICQNARTHPLPQVILNANQDAHEAIDDYASDNGIENPVWLYYKLINVQYNPFDVTDVVSDTTSDLNESTYYTNNEVIETDYTLANFSGQISDPGPPTNLPPNFEGFNPDRTTFQNVLLFDENNELTDTFNMGGCLGCHGVAQVNKGTDFSFILANSRVAVPETPDVDPPGTTNPAPLPLLRP